MDGKGFVSLKPTSQGSIMVAAPVPASGARRHAWRCSVILESVGGGRGQKEDLGTRACGDFGKWRLTA
ncbi:hypothetical protein PsYK624_132680 [Phanerochaete sordida]|uniref:Uncharacterized protein n=1 Tax=Phanerochaete sordida TaxID=48140 RepID=A0A9P3GLD0_9APHY|nr:hypothetical protein PsYK624_132680 [Phanerochaete sordida]